MWIVWSSGEGHQHDVTSVPEEHIHSMTDEADGDLSLPCVLPLPLLSRRCRIFGEGGVGAENIQIWDLDSLQCPRAKGAVTLDTWIHGTFGESFIPSLLSR